MVFLITSWFGSFRFNADGSLDQMILFEKNVDDICKNLEEISENNVLKEEKELIQGCSDVIVNQKRLRSIGHYDPYNNFFSSYQPLIKSYCFSNNLLRESSIQQSLNCVNKKLKLPDFQVIQKMQTIDDLLTIMNLLDERIHSWNIFFKENEQLKPIQHIKKQVSEEVKRLQDEIKFTIKDIAPNTTLLIGPLLVARLLVHAGSMEKLARLPASSIQLLGAEKALFRFKKEGGRPPKHGVLFQHESLLKSTKKMKGKIARILSLKIIIAIRADVYTKRSIGDQLKDEFESHIAQMMKKQN